MSALPPIAVLRPSYGPEEEAAVASVLRRGWTASGPEVEAFEREFAAFLGLTDPRQVVATSSCTAALHLALSQVDVRDRNVVVPAITFVSTAHAVQHAGGGVLFADVDEDSLCLDPTTILPVANTDVVVPVHMAGRPADMRAIWAYADEHDLTVVEDCAHAVGAHYLDTGRHVGTNPRTRFGCFSFQAVKHIGAGDGGAVVCRDVADADVLRRMRWCGINRSTFDRSSIAGRYTTDYDVDCVGYKFQMSELNAAVARVQLQRLFDTRKARWSVFGIYVQELRKLDWLRLPEMQDVRDPHLYVVRMDPNIRPRLVEHLSAAGIHTSVHYKSLNRHSIYRGHVEPKTPVAWKVDQEILSLPMHAAMSIDDTKWVVDAVRSFKP